MAHNVRIRPLTPAHVDDYLKIRLSTLQNAPDAFGLTYADAAARPLAQHAERLAASTVFGAYDGAAIIGMAGFRRESGLKDAHKGCVWGFYVDLARRREGVGKVLMRALVENARGVVEQLTLAVVVDNTAAIALYESFGFRRYGLEPRALKTADRYFDELMMVLFLDETS